jgi:hypothetical protein
VVLVLRVSVPLELLPRIGNKSDFYKRNTNGFPLIRVYFDWDQNGVLGMLPIEIYDLGTLATSTGMTPRKLQPI